MCEASAAMMGAGMIMQGLGARQAARAEAASMRWNAARNRRNALEVEEMADKTIESTYMTEQDMDMEVSRIAGSGRAKFAGAGVSVVSGSVMDWEDDLYDQAGRDIETSRWNLEQELLAFGRQARDLREEANQLEAGAKAVKRAGDMALLGAGLGAAGAGLSASGKTQPAAPTTMKVRQPTTKGISK
jgi:hypothetical protein